MTTKTAAVTIESASTYAIARNAALVIFASLVIALCSRLSLPLPFTPVPLSMASFAVLTVGLTLGSRRGFAASSLYLMMGAAGMPVFAFGGLGGPAQLLGPTGGFLVAYPLVAFVAGWIAERGAKNFAVRSLAAVAADLVLFVSGAAWFMVLTHASLRQAVMFSVFPFLFGEVAKVLMASAVAGRLCRASSR